MNKSTFYLNYVRTFTQKLTSKNLPMSKNQGKANQPPAQAVKNKRLYIFTFKNKNLNKNSLDMF